MSGPRLFGTQNYSFFNKGFFSVLSSSSSSSSSCLFNISIATLQRRSMTTETSANTKKYYALFYNYVDGMLEKRTPFRAAHLELANKYVEAGHFKLGGAWNPVSGGLLIFHVPSRSIVEEFAQKDPYVLNKLVTSWEIREWTVVVDGFKAN